MGKTQKKTKNELGTVVNASTYDGKLENVMDEVSLGLFRLTAAKEARNEKSNKIASLFSFTTYI